MQNSLEAYRAACAAKRGSEYVRGITGKIRLPDSLFDHQKHGVDFALRTGSSALFYDTGLGKTAMEAVWGQAIVEHTNRPVLWLAPLAVSQQHIREAERLGIEAHLSRFGEPPSSAKIVVTNYERLEKFDPADYAAVMLDESSILKSFTGARSRQLRQAFVKTPFRLAASATPAPNDFTELGQHSDFLSVMPSREMLSRFFIADQANAGQYRLKRAAVRPFFMWVASWARCVSKPSDLGFSDDGFVLPNLNIIRRVVESDRTIDVGEENDGQIMLFRMPSNSATSIHKEKRITKDARAAEYARVVDENPGVPICLWVDTDYEAEAVRAAVPEAVEVSGKMTADQKEERLDSFSRGETRVLLTKASIAGYGLNWQHCHTTAYPANYSYEQSYQLLRRFWRFGQKNQVDAYEISSDTESQIIATRSRKGDDHERMKVEMATAMKRAALEHSTLHTYEPAMKGTLPAWMVTA